MKLRHKPDLVVGRKPERRIRTRGKRAHDTFEVFLREQQKRLSYKLERSVQRITVERDTRVTADETFEKRS
jgi:hypothetical protein